MDHSPFILNLGARFRFNALGGN